MVGHCKEGYEDERQRQKHEFPLLNIIKDVILN
jgi:hypothetical protein